MPYGVVLFHYLNVELLDSIINSVKSRGKIFWGTFVVVFGFLEHHPFFNTIGCPHPLDLLLMKPIAHHVSLEVLEIRHGSVSEVS
jgi:hypothetical protein